MINTPNGGDLIRKENVSSMIVQELDVNGEIVRIQEGIPKGETKMAEEEYVPLESEVRVEDVEVVFKNEVVNETPTEKTVVATWETIPVDLSGQQIEPEKIPMTEEVKNEETVDIPTKFVSFREKFLDYETKADSFESEIIEKMARRVERLKSFSDVLDKENDYLEEFKNEKLGQ